MQHFLQGVWCKGKEKPMDYIQSIKGRQCERACKSYEAYVLSSLFSRKLL